MAGDIQDWIEKLKEFWLKKDIDEIVNLFDKSVIYFESFSLKIPYENLAEEWAVIMEQNSLNLKFDVFVSCNQKHAVIWNLEYSNSDGKKESYSGTYLIELNEDNLCTYFFQTCDMEEKK